MKLLLLIPSLGSGGAERQLVNLALIFKKKGIDVEFLIYHNDLFYGHLLEGKGISINQIRCFNFLDKIFKVIKFIKKNKPDVVLSFLETCDFLNCFSSIFNTHKVITTELSSKDTTFDSLRGKIFGWFRRFSHQIVCNSFNSQKKWINNYPHYKDKMSVIYNPINLQCINTHYIFKKNNKINLVVAASYQYLKNPIGLIKAVSMLNKEQQNKIQINWYGRKEVSINNTKAYDEAVKLVKEYQLEDTFFLHAETIDIANKMHQADVVGLFSSVEGLPNAICEAMLIGKPIIMTRVSDFEQLVNDDNGFLCDANDFYSIFEVLKKIIELDSDRLSLLGENSKKKAAMMFNNKLILDQWLNVLGFND